MQTLVLTGKLSGLLDDFFSMNQSDVVKMVADNSPLSPFPKVRGLKNVFFFVSTERSMPSVWVMKSSSTSALSESSQHRLYMSAVVCCEVFSHFTFCATYRRAQGRSSRPSRCRQPPRSTRDPRGHCRGCGTCCQVAPLLG